ncbi:biliverdin-producing heme oxygenase [Planomonospora parontospora]|uniref:biliverdin-producing heme oxygenase n=1 Tax=Planomonospora parontospora TaxID=58119 RepID=UPI00166FFD7A|nr:biliverdin-producing heme oxygenase [Planomonospora parontospora]GGL25037.1 biliverdin-producing heme oxygenase [Planomonospora parontospora subsp. antibiotica]GII16382.1 biliverdin-producing heme oxygenase [Planomonospora parontospora subsp. antibiotica]
MSQAPFSEVLRTATWGDHASAEDDGYLKALMAGRLSREAYGELVAQHYFTYVALDGASQELAGDPVAGPFVLPELYREEALVRDLETVYGARWADRIEPSKPTLTLVARINQVAAWPGGYIAHHYTRYMGDLSGGQFIRMELEKIYGFGPGGGVDFYRFDRVGSLPRFKDAYRARLDALPVDEPEKQRIIRETRLAYQLNTEVLADLGRVARAELAA